MLDDNDIGILEEIIDIDGDCLGSTRCLSCPFRKNCLPKFLRPAHERPSKSERVNAALDILTRHTLLDDEQEFILGD